MGLSLFDLGGCRTAATQPTSPTPLPAQTAIIPADGIPAALANDDTDPVVDNVDNRDAVSVPNSVPARIPQRSPWFQTFAWPQQTRVVHAAFNEQSVWLIGAFRQPIDADPGPGTRTLTPEQGAMFLIELDHKGQLQTASVVPGNPSQQLLAADHCDDGSFAVAGRYTTLTGLPLDSQNAAVPPESAQHGSFVGVLETSGHMRWLRIMPHLKYGQPIVDVGCAPDGGVFLTGHPVSPRDTREPSDVWTPKPLARRTGQYIARWHADGRFDWARHFFSQQNVNTVTRMTVTDQGAAVACGRLPADTMFDANTLERFRKKLPSALSNLPYALQLDRRGTLSWVHVWPSGDLVYHPCTDIAHDRSGDIYIVGQHPLGGRHYALQLTRDGEQTWLRRWSGQSHDYVNAIAVAGDTVLISLNANAIKDLDPGATLDRMISHGAAIVRLSRAGVYKDADVVSTLNHANTLLAADGGPLLVIGTPWHATSRKPNGSLIPPGVGVSYLSAARATTPPVGNPTSLCSAVKPASCTVCDPGYGQPCRRRKDLWHVSELHHLTHDVTRVGWARDGTAVLSGLFEGTVDFDSDNIRRPVSTHGIRDGFVTWIAPSGARRTYTVRSRDGASIELLGVGPRGDALLLVTQAQLSDTPNERWSHDLALPRLAKGQRTYELVRVSTKGDIVWRTPMQTTGRHVSQVRLLDDGSAYIALTVTTDSGRGATPGFGTHGLSAIIRLDRTGKLVWKKSSRDLFVRLDTGVGLGDDSLVAVEASGYLTRISRFNASGRTMWSHTVHWQTTSGGRYHPNVYTAQGAISLSGVFQGHIDFTPTGTPTHSRERVKGVVVARYAADGQLLTHARIANKIIPWRGVWPIHDTIIPTHDGGFVFMTPDAMKASEMPRHRIDNRAKHQQVVVLDKNLRIRWRRFIPAPHSYPHISLHAHENGALTVVERDRPANRRTHIQPHDWAALFHVRRYDQRGRARGAYKLRGLVDQHTLTLHPSPSGDLLMAGLFQGILDTAPGPDTRLIASTNQSDILWLRLAR